MAFGRPPHLLSRNRCRAIARKWRSRPARTRRVSARAHGGCCYHDGNDAEADIVVELSDTPPRLQPYGRKAGLLDFHGIHLGFRVRLDRAHRTVPRDVGRKRQLQLPVRLARRRRIRIEGYCPGRSFCSPQSAARKIGSQSGTGGRRKLVREGEPPLSSRL